MSTGSLRRSLSHRSLCPAPGWGGIVRKKLCISCGACVAACPVDAIFRDATGKGQLISLDGRNQVAGGSGLAALIFQKFGKPAAPWNDPEQPLIFAIGP